MKALLFLMILPLVSIFNVQAQSSIDTIRFNYDRAGNRTSREIIYQQGGLKSLSTTIEEETTTFLHDLKIYPNPASQSVYVTLNEKALKATNSHVVFYDNLGKKMAEYPVDNYVNELDVSYLNNGIYILKLIYGLEHKEWIFIKN